MLSRSVLLPLLFTSSLFLVHCSGNDDSAGKAGASGTSTGATGGVGGGAGTTSSAGTGGSAGTVGSAGKAATGGSAGTGGSSGSSAQGGSSGTAPGQGGMGGVMMAGRGGAGGAGMSAGGAGKGSAGMSGAGGSVGTGAGGMGGATGGSAGKGMAGGGSGGAGSMTLTSSVITEGGMFPDTTTCAGTDKSPDLTWTAGPSGTMSYAVILFDTSNSLNHWVIWDIPSSVTMLPAALDTAAMLTMPAGAKQKAVSGTGYYGPCPNGADHVYRFTVYALSTATLAGAMTSQQTSALSTAVMSANPLASASLSAHSSAKMGGN